VSDGVVLVAAVTAAAATAAAATTATAVYSQSSRIPVFQRLDNAMFDLVLGHLAHDLQFRFGRLSQPPEHLHGLPVLGGPVPVAGPPGSFHLHDPRQRGRRFVVRLAPGRLLFAVDHHSRRPVRIARLTRLYTQVGPRRRRVRRKTRPV